MRYQVRRWDNDQVIREFDILRRAQNCAKLQGHTGEDIEICTSYPPIAYVWDTNPESEGLCYNPRFSKQIGAGVAGYINSIPGGSL
jgi:hypothetical protein